MSDEETSTKISKAPATLPATLATGATISTILDPPPPTSGLVQGGNLPPIMSFMEIERENREKKEAYLAAQERARIERNEKAETATINKFLKSKEGIAYITNKVKKGVREARAKHKNTQRRPDCFILRTTSSRKDPGSIEI